MSSRCEVDLSPRSRSACSNFSIRARTDIAGSSAGRMAAALEHPPERGREVDRLDVAPGESVEQHLDTLLGREVPVEEEDVGAAHAGEAAAHAIADLAQ